MYVHVMTLLIAVGVAVVDNVSALMTRRRMWPCGCSVLMFFRRVGALDPSARDLEAGSVFFSGSQATFCTIIIYSEYIVIRHKKVLSPVEPLTNTG